VDHQIVGHVALVEPTNQDDAARLWSEDSGTRLSDIAVLCRLFVSPAHRGHQLGARLTQTATAMAHTLDRTPVLDVMAKDRAAIRLYESLGWTPIADIRHQHSDGLQEPASVYRGPSPPKA
ncbi:MAG: GNAT family N-acetyltransferase, partial [Dermatophilaceae bacterium]